MPALHRCAWSALRLFCNSESKQIPTQKQSAFMNCTRHTILSCLVHIFKHTEVVVRQDSHEFARPITNSIKLAAHSSTKLLPSTASIAAHVESPSDHLVFSKSESGATKLHVLAAIQLQLIIIYPSCCCCCCP
jgi:hypothetical protein